MKKKKVLTILFLTAFVMIITIITSFIIDSNSQKLPAVVKSNKVIISTEVSGTISEYFVSSMQKVKKGDSIAKLENPRLLKKLQALHKEYENYHKLIESATDGDLLKLELYEIDEEILKSTSDLNEAKHDFRAISAKLNLLSSEYENTQKKYESIKNLYSKEMISLEDYKEKSKNYLNSLAKYTDAKSESLLVSKEIDAHQMIIRMQNAQKNILKNNVSILASKNQIELDKIESEITDLEQDLENLTIVSPLNGIVTDLRNRPGEKVKNGDVIAEISDINDIWLTAYGNSYASKNLISGNKVTIFCNNNSNKISGKVISISPVMEKVKSLSSSFETSNTYTKIEVAFDDKKQAMDNLTPGERLFVRISLK